MRVVHVVQSILLSNVMDEIMTAMGRQMKGYSMCVEHVVPQMILSNVITKIMIVTDG